MPGTPRAPLAFAFSTLSLQSGAERGAAEIVTVFSQCVTQQLVWILTSGRPQKIWGLSFVIAGGSPEVESLETPA